MVGKSNLRRRYVVTKRSKTKKRSGQGRILNQTSFTNF